jgi:hypothetical protein
MSKIGMVLMTVMLAACNKAAPSYTANSLVAHPDQLREVEQQCASD